jgi:alpha,alpha-trehalose phosphorylase
VNNNAYTNLMARENLRYAAQTVESLRATTPEAYNALVHKPRLEPWRSGHGAESMYVPYDEKLKLFRRMTTF